MDTLPLLVDSHAHLDDAAFDADRETLIDSMKASGLECLVTIGEDIESSRRAANLADRCPRIFASAGWHPHKASDFREEALSEIRSLLSMDKVVALGEIGLDYYYDNSPREIQRAVFSRFLELALEMDRPVIIHNRDSDSDLIAILDTFRTRSPRGVVHCFTGSLETAAACLDRGFFLSFSGILTFNKAQSIRDVAAWAPMDRILVETDCPYLAPVPHRGKRNEPSFVRYVAETLAGIKGVSLERIAEQTRRNTYACYGIAPGGIKESKEAQV